jgi:ATP-binding cassette, subfamily B, bacterial PglK
MIEAFLRAASQLSPRNKKLLMILFAVIAMGSLLEVMSVGLVFPLIKVIDNPAESTETGFLAVVRAYVQPADDREFLEFMVIAFGLIFLFKNVFIYISTVWQTWFLMTCEAEVSQRLYQGYLASPYAMHLHRNSAELIRNLIECLPSFYSGVMSYGMRAITEIIVAISISVILFVAAPIPAMFATAIMGGGLLVFYLIFRRPMADWGRERHQRRGERLQFLQQSLNGIKEIKVLNRELFFSALFLRVQKALIKVQVRVDALSELPRMTLEILMVWVIVAVAFYHLSEDSAGSETVAVLGLFGAAGFRLMPCVNRLLGAIAVIRQSVAGVGWVHEDFETFGRQRIEETLAAEIEEIDFQRLTIDKVSFQYPGAETAALKDIELDIKKGESIALVGASGAGKSTLVDIILGLYAPTSGRVLVNTEDISQNSRPWQRKIGYVPQSIYLFDDTMRRNIALGEDDLIVNEKDLRRAVEQAQIDTFIQSLPEGLGTVLGEQGVRLSGGQRQRVGIARALYNDPELLVFDEATSALDNETETAVTAAIDALQGEKTTILIAHRLSTVRHCDRIVLMTDGRITDIGSFHELATRNEAFKHMVELGSVTPDNSPHADQKE